MEEYSNRITLTEARGLLARAVLTQGPDFIYTPMSGSACFYRPLSPDEAISGEDQRLRTPCLIGVALNLRGETRHWYHSGPVCYQTDDFGQKETLSGQYPDMMTRQAAQYFAVAQRMQDSGEPWGVAYAAAEASLAPEAISTNDEGN